MAILTGPDYRIPPYVLDADRKLPPNQQTKWLLRQPGTAASARIKGLLGAIWAGRAYDPRHFDDGLQLVLEGWENLRAGAEELSFLTRPNSRELLGEKHADVVEEELLRRIPLDWKIELLAHAIAPQLTPEDVGN